MKEAEYDSSSTSTSTMVENCGGVWPRTYQCRIVVGISRHRRVLVWCVLFFVIVVLVCVNFGRVWAVELVFTIPR